MAGERQVVSLLLSSRSPRGRAPVGEPPTGASPRALIAAQLLHSRALPRLLTAYFPLPPFQLMLEAVEWCCERWRVRLAWRRRWQTPGAGLHTSGRAWRCCLATSSVTARLGTGWQWHIICTSSWTIRSYGPGSVMAGFVYFTDWQVRKPTVLSLPSLCGQHGQPLLLGCLPRLPPDMGCRALGNCVAARYLPAN